MEEKEEGGISIGDIFRTIFSQKWLALIITAVITVVGTVGIYFYGSTKVDYSVLSCCSCPVRATILPRSTPTPTVNCFTTPL